MSDTSNNTSGGIVLTGAVFIVFLVLKFTHVINWSWWITAPLWIPAGFGLVAFAVVVLLAARKDKREGVR